MPAVMGTRLEGSIMDPVRMGDLVLGEHAALCVCARGLPWSKMRVLLPTAGGREEGQQGQERAQEDREVNNETTSTSSIIMFVTHCEHATTTILPRVFVLVHLDGALLAFHNLGARLLQVPEIAHF
jgi:hypothetical protein